MPLIELLVVSQHDCAEWLNIKNSTIPIQHLNEHVSYEHHTFVSVQLWMPDDHQWSHSS